MTSPQESFDLVPARRLAAYLLGALDFDTLLSLQRRLVFDISGDRDTAALVIYEPQPGITIGREGSFAHVRPNAKALAARGWSVRWVARGGGTMLHVPGQVACYPILPLDMLNLTPGRYIRELQLVALDLLHSFGIEGTPDTERPGVRANGRRIAHIGIAVRNWVSCFGLVVNANPDLTAFREVRCDGDPMPMTSLARESCHRVGIATVRQRLVELIVQRFGFDRVFIFHTHPAALPRPTRYAIPHGP